MQGPKVVELHPNTPSLQDVSGRLRMLADSIERGDYGKVEAAYVLLTHNGAFRPTFFGFGNIADRHGIAGLFAHCAQLALADAGS